MKRRFCRWAAACQIALAASVLVAGWAPAGEVSPNDKFLWSCYMICWPLNRDYHGFYDRPLDQAPADGSNPRGVDLRRAIEAGADALSVDLFIADKNALGAFGQLVKLVDEGRLPIQLSPMFDGLGDPGLSLDDVAEKIEQWFQRFAKAPCVVRVGGRPVLFTYGASSRKPAEWQQLWQRLKAAGCEGYWIAELSHCLSVGEAPDFTAARPWIELFPAVNSFNVHSPERSRELCRRFAEQSPAGQRWVAPVSIGYWRPEIAVYTSQRGTGLFRDTWRTIIDSDVRWVQQSTWNDFSENHHIMPSANSGTTFVELNRWFAQQWKGRPEQPASARLWLSQQQEVLVGEEAELELLAIVPAGQTPLTMQLRVLDGDVRLVHRFPDAAARAAGLQVMAVRLPIDKVPAGRILLAEGELVDAQRKTVARVSGPATVVAPGAYRPERNFSWLHSSSQDARPAIGCTLKLEQARAALRVGTGGELADVEVLRNGYQLLSLRHDLPGTRLVAPLDWQGTLPLNRLGRLDAGTYTARAITADGRTAVSRPVFIDRPAEADVTLGLWTFDDDDDRNVLDGSPWLHDGRLGGRPRRKPWFPAYAADRWGGRCLSFDGVDDRVLLEGPIVPPQSFTVECWIRPSPRPDAARSGQILFATANAAVVLSLDAAGHLQVTRKSPDGWRRAADRSPVAVTQWQHVAATFDGALLRLYRSGRLVGDCAAAGEGRCGQVSIGYNSVTNESFYCGLLDELRLSSRPLAPEEFGPHNPLRETP